MARQTVAERMTRQVNKLIEEARDEGVEEGLQRGRREMIEWLEQTYIDDEERPDRGTAKAEAILEIARAAGAYLRSKGVE